MQSNRFQRKRAKENKGSFLVKRQWIPALSGLAVLVASTTGLPGPLRAQQFTPTMDVTNVNIQVVPIAELMFTGSNLLYLKVPPPGSTIPFSGVEFVVSGNASATLVAEPSAFLVVPGQGHIGKAVQNGEEIGYKVELRFPSVGVIGSNPQYAALPQYAPGPTVPPLTTNLMLTGGEREGVLHLEASPNWTATGGIPLPGIYVGQVTLTLMADY